MNVPPPDDAAHDDGLLVHELTVVNTQVSRYVFHFLDADAGRSQPITEKEDRELAESLRTLAGRLEARANKRAALNRADSVEDGPDHE